MSCLTAILLKDQVFFATDSCVSAKFNEQIYRVNGEAQKIHVIDGMMIFMSGMTLLLDAVLSRFSKCDDRSISKLGEICKQSYMECSEKLLDETIAKFNVVLARMEKKGVTVYSISPFNDFEWEIYSVPQDQTTDNDGSYDALFISGGTKTKEAKYALEKHIASSSNLQIAFQRTYDEISFEGIGGKLSVYKMDRLGTSKIYEAPIKEKPDMLTLNINYAPAYAVTTDQLIAGSAKIGGALIDGNTLTVPAANITGLLTAAQINATNLQVAAANVTGTLTAAQIDATNLHVNVANLDGSLTVGTNVGLGTAQDANGVTTIINNTVTTGYVNALNVTAQSVNAAWVYAGTVNANQINGGTISGVTINVSTDLTVGNNIYIGDQTATAVSKRIAFNGAANISTISDGITQEGIGISASLIQLGGGPIEMENTTVRFTGSTIVGLQAPIYFV